jgi:hypothetical protein
MITLDEFNKSRAQVVSNKPTGNGIACPECGSELIDSNPLLELASYPPQKNVNCSKCDYVGCRLA